LPRRDAQLDDERNLAKLQAYGQQRAAQERSVSEQERLLSEQKALEKRRSAAKAAADTGYQTCLNSASATHDALWAAACQRLAETALGRHAACLSKSGLSQSYCNAAYKTRDGSANCTLPVEIAAELDGNLNMARNRCLQEHQAALQ
jgi:hypothetical protein